MVGGVGDALVDLGGDLLHGAFALCEDVDDLGSAAAGQRLGDLGQASNSASLAARSPMHPILDATAGPVNPQTIT